MALGGADMSLVAATLGVRVAAQAASSQAQREPMMVHGITPTSMLTPDLLASRASRAPRRRFWNMEGDEARRGTSCGPIGHRRPHRSASPAGRSLLSSPRSRLSTQSSVYCSPLRSGAAYRVRKDQSRIRVFSTRCGGGWRDAAVISLLQCSTSGRGRRLSRAACARLALVR